MDKSKEKSKEVVQHQEDLRELCCTPIVEAIDPQRMMRARFVEMNEAITAREIAKIMHNEEVTAVYHRPVTGGLWTITQADLRAIPNANWEIPAAEIATRSVETFQWDDPIRVAFTTFEIDGKRNVPVVNADGNVLGVLRPRNVVQLAMNWEPLLNLGFWNQPAVDLVDAHNRRRRDQLRLNENATLGQVISKFIELKGAAIRIPEEGRATKIFTESDLLVMAATGYDAAEPIREYASDIDIEDPLPIDATAMQVAERMLKLNRRHILLGDGEFVLVPRDIVQGIVDIDYSSMCAPRNLANTAYGG